MTEKTESEESEESPELSVNDVQTIAELGALLEAIVGKRRAIIPQELKRAYERIKFLETENRDLIAEHKGMRKESTERCFAYNALTHHVNISQTRCAELKAKIRKLKKKRRNRK